MCRIVGYVGEQQAAGVLVEGLKKLEYRGYDSAGIAIHHAGEFVTVKTKGRLKDLEEKIKQVGTPEGTCGIGHTRWATHGEPSDIIAVLEKDSVTVYTTDGETVERETLTADWDVEAAEKDGYPHFMLKEIFEQTKALNDTISPRLKDFLVDFSNEKIPDSIFENTNKIHIVACGTAMHAGMIGKNIIETLARVDVDVQIASAFRYRNPIFHENDLMMVISQSGETADTLAALRLAKQQGITTLAVVNVVGSSIAREADYVIYTWAGPEIAVASTKAYTVQLGVMYLLAIKFALAKGKIDLDSAKKMGKTLLTMPSQMQKILEKTDDCKYYASRFQNAANMFFYRQGS